MRKYGEIDGVSFTLERFSIYTLAYEYKLRLNGNAEVVNVCNMTELRDEIRKLTGGVTSDQNQIQVPSMHDYRETPEAARY